MANTDLVSFTVQDAVGVQKTIPVYFPSGMTLANIQVGADAYALALDAAIDAKILSYHVQLQLTPVGGLKGAAGAQVAKMGALLDYDAANTPYRHGIFIPSWKEAGFVLNAVSAAGVYGTLQALITSGAGTGGSELKPSDRYANDLVAYLEGSRRFRK